MRRLSSNSRKNQGLQGVPGGRARDADRGAAAVPRQLEAAGTGDRSTNKAEAYNGFSAWTPVRQPGRDRRERPGRAGRSVKWNSLLCNLIVFHTALDMMEVIRQLVAEGWQVTAEDLAQLSPYMTSHILRFGAYATDGVVTMPTRALEFGYPLRTRSVGVHFKPWGLAPFLALLCFGMPPNLRVVSCRSCKKSIGRQRPAVQRVAGMFAHEPPPDFDVPGRREPGDVGAGANEAHP
jgi:hypothetical protein